MGYLIIQTRGPSPLFLPTLFNTLNRITGGIKKRKKRRLPNAILFFETPLNIHVRSQMWWEIKAREIKRYDWLSSWASGSCQSVVIWKYLRFIYFLLQLRGIKLDSRRVCVCTLFTPKHNLLPFLFSPRLGYSATATKLSFPSFVAFLGRLWCFLSRWASGPSPLVIS